MMKNYAHLYTLICSIFVTLSSATIFAQNTKSHSVATIVPEKHITLAEALKQLEQKNGKTIIFAYDDVSGYTVKKVPLQLPLDEALQLLLNRLPLTFTDKGTYILINKKEEKQPDLSESSAIHARITDMQGSPIEAALIWLIDPDTNHCISQAISDADGNFCMSFPKQKLILFVSCLGYATYTSNILTKVSDFTLPAIRLSSDIQQIEDIIVVGERIRPIIEQKGGKLVFNIENSINAQGDNALEILRQTPGVSINEAGKSITINGRTGILVTLNGKQTYMEQSEIMDLLKSTPSSNIKQIEIMSNATAQYDASGSGGILNIVLKKQNQKGYNMQINTGFAYWLNPKQNTEISFNFNRNRFNLYGNYNHIFGYTGLFYGSSRKQSGKLFDSRSEDIDKRNIIGTTVGMDYELNTEHRIGAQFNGNFLFGPGGIQTYNLVYDSYDKTSLLYAMYSESNYYHQVSNRYTANLNYIYEKENKRSLAFDFDYSLFKGNSGNKQPNIYYSPEGKTDSTLNYRSTGGRDISLYAVSLNYKENLREKGEFTAGIKYSDVSSENSYRLYSEKTTNDCLDKQSSNDFRYRESILAAFLMYDTNIGGKWQLNAGFRIEHTRSKGTLIPVQGSLVSSSESTKSYTDYFPSASFTYRINEQQTLSLSYGKRIDRPVYSDLNPIDQPLDGLSSWRGNPFLDPQKTHRLSLQYQYKQTALEASYSVTDDYRVQITDTLGTDKIVMLPRNLGKQTYYGLAATQSFRFFHAWNISLSGRAYHLNNRMAFDEKRFYNRQRWAFGFSLHTSFPLWWNIKMEMLGIYSSKRLGSSTDILGENGLVNIGIQRKFLNDRASIKLSLSDLFWTANWDSVNRFDGFDTVSYGYGESRTVKINFTFRFGTSNKKHTKESNIDDELNRF